VRAAEQVAATAEHGAMGNVAAAQHGAAGEAGDAEYGAPVVAAEHRVPVQAAVAPEHGSTGQVAASTEHGTPGEPAVAAKHGVGWCRPVSTSSHGQKSSSSMEKYGNTSSPTRRVRRPVEVGDAFLRLYHASRGWSC
jgi:hypothetical protein